MQNLTTKTVNVNSLPDVVVKAIEDMTQAMNSCGNTFNYAIAGGVFRDILISPAEVEDIDIFFYGRCVPTMEEAEEILKALGGEAEYVDTLYGGRYITSLKSTKTNINLVIKPGCSSLTELLNQFSADISMIGIDIPEFGFDKTRIELSYSEKGIQNLLVNKEVEFYLTDSGLPSLVTYASKMSKKSWAKGFTFTYKGKLYTHSKVVKESWKAPDELSSYTDTALEVWGVFNDKDVVEGYDDFVRECSEDFMSFRVEGYRNEDGFTGIPSRFFYEGIYNLGFCDQLKYLEEFTSLGIAVTKPEGDHAFNPFDDSLSEPHQSVFNKLIGTWKPSEMEAYGNDLCMKGWDFFKDKSKLSLEDRIELSSKGRYREIWKNSIHISAMLKGYGFDNLLKWGVPVPSGPFKSTNFSKALALLGHQVKRKVFKLPEGVAKFGSASKLLSAIKWASILGTNWQHLSEYDLMHTQRLVSVVKMDNLSQLIPMKYKAEVAKSSSLLSWLFERDLYKENISWQGKSARQVIEKHLQTTRKLSEQEAQMLFDNPSIEDVFDYIALNPNVSVEHNFKDVNFKEGDLSLEMLDKSDPVNLYIGEMTACCQKLGGFGNDVCEEGWNDAHSVNYVYKRNGKIVAHMWVWESLDGSLVIDSIEGRDNVNPKHVSALVRKFAEAVPQDVYLSDTHYGLTRPVVGSLPTATQRCPKPIVNYSYRDAKGKVYLIG